MNVDFQKHFKKERKEILVNRHSSGPAHCSPCYVWICTDSNSLIISVVGRHWQCTSCSVVYVINKDKKLRS